jgi:two-component system LytT family sensor kinase
MIALPPNGLTRARTVTQARELVQAQPHGLGPQQILLTTLVVKLAVSGLIAIVLVRFHRFTAILLTERRVWHDRLLFALALGVPVCAGVVLRLLRPESYQAADLTLEATFLAGLIAGPYAGALVGVMCGVPPLFAGEFGALPFAVGCGFAGGGLRELCPKPDIWHFSPFVFTSLHRRLWRTMRTLQIDWQLVLVLAPIGMEGIRIAIGHRVGVSRLFYLAAPTVWTDVALIVATVLAIAIPIKIWNSARIEHQLVEQEKLLMAARLEALSSQINPHFLFNTLNSISSLIRSKPETARMLIGKLSNLMRQRLKSRNHFVSLREELHAIDQYLDIEVIRFGPQLRVRKEIGPDTLDLIVPSMILQPLIENSIKHGLTAKLGGGTVTLRSFRTGESLIVEVADDGFGMSPEQLQKAMTAGIGLSNVNERLMVTYGANHPLALTSAADQGTCARVEIPLHTAVGRTEP